MPFRVIRISLYLLVCIFYCPLYCFSQKSESYNINIYNGLPSNNVYALVVDHNGYLWISTDQGVARYDGHNAKVFDLTKGFINKDIWSLTEDKKGRIWLYSISENFGFIHQDQYKYIFSSFPVNYIYPRFEVYSYPHGVCFISGIFSNVNSPKLSFCVERGDSLVVRQDIDEYGFVANIIDEHHLVVLDTGGMLNAIEISGRQMRAKQMGGVILDTPYTNPRVLMQELISVRSFAFYKYIISYSVGKDFVNVINIRNRVHKKISIATLTNSREDELISLVTMGAGILTIITDRHIYKLDTGLKLIRAYLIDSIQQDIRGKDINYFVDDPFWGKIIATYNKGVYIKNCNVNFWRPGRFDLTDYNFIGNVSSGESYWWSKSTSTMAKIVNHATIQYKHMNLYRPAKIIPFSNDTSLLLSQLSIKKLVNNSLATIDFMADNNGLDGVATNSKFYLISKTRGFFYADLKDSAGEAKVVDNDRFNGMTYDSVRHVFWLYNNSKILIYKEGGAHLSVSSKQLGAVGINRIQKILIDGKYGNIFIQEDGRLLHYTDLNRPYKRLFGNYALNDAKVTLLNGNLIAAGKFGILFSRVIGSGEISEPVVLPNIKRIKYSIVYDLEISNNEVFVKTDKGTFITPIPSPGDFIEEKNAFLSYKLLLSYDNQLTELRKEDTISIQKGNYRLQFNLIKPSGDAHVKYMYKFSGSGDLWRDMNTNELNLPDLPADNYYSLSLIVSDDQWSSNVIEMKLYTVPYWWETTNGQRVLWLIAGGIVLLMIYAVVIITKSIVTKNHKERSFRLELELKSVYSQINPHFIFNTLGVALYLVKTKKLDEAYHHIHKFSNLLRSYIKSSRNRFILLNEEIGNLRNYIDLQQARFGDKFIYEIIVEHQNITGMLIPSLLLQPIVENAIIHGLLHKEQEGRLKITFRQGKTEKEIICIIDDDGIGRQRSKLIKDEYMVKEESYGNLLIKDLIAIFNKYETMKIEMEYIDKEIPLTGTIVILNIKDLS